MSDLLTIILGGFQLPDQVQFIETTTPNAVDVRTLGGDLYTDFINYYRSWTVGFDAITGTDWNQILALYKSQYENEQYLSLVCVALTIDTMVKLDLGEAFWQWSGQQVGDGSLQYYPLLTLTEQSPIS